MNNHICNDCQDEAKVACMCMGEVKKFCYIHFIPHFEDKLVFHKILNIEDLDKIDLLDDAKRLRLEKIINQMNKHQKDIENHNKSYVDLKQQFLDAVNVVFSDDDFTYNNVLTEIKAKQVKFSSLTYFQSEDIDRTIQNFKQLRLSGVLEEYKEIQPIDIRKVFEKLVKKLGVPEDPEKIELQKSLKELTEQTSLKITSLETELNEVKIQHGIAEDKKNDLETKMNNILQCIRKHSYLDKSCIEETTERPESLELNSLPDKIIYLYEALSHKTVMIESLQSEVSKLSIKVKENRARVMVHDIIEYSLQDTFNTDSSASLLNLLSLGKCIKANFPNIRSLDFTSMNLEYNGIRTLFNATFPSLQTLILFDNSIGAQGAEVLANSELHNLTHLDLGLNELEVHGMIALSRCHFPNLKFLNLEGNNITKEGMNELYAFTFTKLMSLNLRSNFLDYESIKSLLTCPKFSSLTHLNLEYNYIKYYDIDKFLRKKFLSLQTLEVNYCNLKEHKFDEIISSDYGHLTYLDLSWRFLQVSGMEILVKCEFDFLTHLNLKYNNIQSEGVELFTRCSLPRLNYLDISWNNIKKEGVESLIKCNLPKLLHLLLASNNIRASGVEILLKNHFTRLITLDLTGNIIGSS